MVLVKSVNNDFYNKSKKWPKSLRLILGMLGFEGMEDAITFDSPIEIIERTEEEYKKGKELLIKNLRDKMIKEGNNNYKT